MLVYLSASIEVCVMFTEPVAQGGHLTISTSPSEATCKTIQGSSSLEGKDNGWGGGGRGDRAKYTSIGGGGGEDIPCLYKVDHCQLT